MTSSITVEQKTPIAVFMYALKAAESRRQYPRRFKIFLDYLRLEGSLNDKLKNSSSRVSSIFERVCRTNVSTWWGSVFDKMVKNGECQRKIETTFSGTYRGAEGTQAKARFLS